jgi:hypothetical protein
VKTDQVVAGLMELVAEYCSNDTSRAALESALRAALADARRMALEEAAKVCLVPYTCRHPNCGEECDGEWRVPIRHRKRPVAAKVNWRGATVC